MAVLSMVMIDKKGLKILVGVTESSFEYFRKVGGSHIDLGKAIAGGKLGLDLTFIYKPTKEEVRNFFSELAEKSGAEVRIM